MITAIIILAVLGLCFGSFINATAWRIHKHKNFVNDRSECDSCHHKLGALDLIPVFSWIFLRGKCRYCQATISWQHPVVEATLAVLFVLSFVFWPQELSNWPAWFGFVAWLIYLVGMTGLFVYDARWMLLPDKLLAPLALVATADIIVKLATTPHMTLFDAAEYIIFGLASIGGIYAALYAVSRGKWVGFGDVKLGFLMGAILGWQKGLLALVLANVIGFLFVVPGLLSRKLKITSRVPFGPFLIIAFVIAGIFGDLLIRWYINTFIFSV